MAILPNGSDIKEMLVGSAKGQLLRIQYCLSFTTLLCVVQHVVGAKRSNSRINLVATQIIYNLPPVAITVTLGLMHTASTIHLLYPVWACALVYAHGGVGTMMVCNISDNDNSVSYLLRTIPLLAWTLWLAAFALYNGTLLQATVLAVTIAVFVALAVSNIMDTLDAFYLASKSKGLPGFVAPTVEHMSNNRDGYLVWRSNNQHATVTTEDIQGTVFLRNFVGLKDMCLSHALFMLILRRFAGFPLHERMGIKARRFIREEFLKSRDAKSVFGVIEAELGFLFSFFYTKSRVYSSYSRRHGVGLIAVLTLVLVSEYGIHVLVPGPEPDRRRRDKSDVTILVISLFTFFWIRNILADSFSDRDMVVYLCEGISKARTDEGEGERLKKFIASSCGNKSRISWIAKCFGNTPWQRKLGQYCFLESYDKAPILSRKFFSPLNVVANLPRLGQDGDYTVALSDHVKRAIVKSLDRHVQDEAQPLSRGTNSLTTNDLWQKLGHESEYMETSSDADVILVWHIATSFCEFESPPNSFIGDDFIVATHLSKYCAYLLTFAPELLPDHRYTTERFFDSAVEQVQAPVNNLQGSKVRQLFRHLNGDATGNEPNIVKRGAFLANVLISQVMMRNRDEGWRVLAEFWAELLLYLAPSDNVDAHGEYLARGGEFITHVWALLTHAGIVER